MNTISRTVTFLFQAGTGNSYLHILNGTVSLIPTNLGLVPPSPDMPEPLSATIVNGVASISGVEPTPLHDANGHVPWAYLLRVVNSQKNDSWEYLVGVPDEASDISYSILPRYFVVAPGTIGSVVPGPRGEKGEKGGPGPQGLQGIQGAQGLNGNTGETGATGPQGLQGIKGNQGEPGVRGLQGIQGDKGDTGAQGVDGAQGEQGTPGVQGPQGIQGPAGKDAADSVVTTANATRSTEFTGSFNVGLNKQGLFTRMDFRIVNPAGSSVPAGTEVIVGVIPVGFRPLVRPVKLFVGDNAGNKTPRHAFIFYTNGNIGWTPVVDPGGNFTMEFSTVY